MKDWIVAVVVLSGCVSEDKPELDATGTVQAQLTWGAGNCLKSGTEGLLIQIAKGGFGEYTVTQTNPGVNMSGFVICGSYYCQIDFTRSWEGPSQESLRLTGTLTLDDNDQVTGTAEYSAFGLSTSCEQTAKITGTLN